MVSECPDFRRRKLAQLLGQKSALLLHVLRCGGMNPVNDRPKLIQAHTPRVKKTHAPVELSSAPVVVRIGGASVLARRLAPSTRKLRHQRMQRCATTRHEAANHN